MPPRSVTRNVLSLLAAWMKSFSRRISLSGPLSIMSHLTPRSFCAYSTFEDSTGRALTQFLAVSLQHLRWSYPIQ